MNWRERLLKALGLATDSPEAKDVLAGTSKHRRQRRRPKNWKAKKRKKRKLAQASKRKNR